MVFFKPEQGPCRFAGGAWSHQFHVTDYRPGSCFTAVEVLYVRVHQSITLLVCWPYSGVVLQDLCKLLYPFGLYGASQQGLCVSVDEEGWDGAQQRAHAKGTQTVIVRVTWDNTGRQGQKRSETVKLYESGTLPTSKLETKVQKHKRKIILRVIWRINKGIINHSTDRRKAIKMLLINCMT